METRRPILERDTKELRWNSSDASRRPCFRAPPQAGDDGWAGYVAVPVQINLTSLNQTPPPQKKLKRKVEAQRLLTRVKVELSHTKRSARSEGEGRYDEVRGEGFIVAAAVSL